MHPVIFCVASDGCFIFITSAAFVTNRASQPVVAHGRLAPKTVIGPPSLEAGEIDPICSSFGGERLFGPVLTSVFKLYMCIMELLE